MTNMLAKPPTRQPAAKAIWAMRVLLVLAVLTAITAGVLGYLGVSRATEQAAATQRAEALAEALALTFELAAALGFERDGALAGVPPVVSRPLQETTDLAAEAWRTGVRDIDSGEDEELDATLDQIDRALVDIDDLRTQAREPGDEAQQRYTDLVNDLFGIAAHLPEVTGEQTASMIEALGSVPEAWESLSQERLLMTTFLFEAQRPGTQRLGEKELASLVEAEAGVRSSLADFYEKTSDQQREALDGLTQDTATEGAVGVPAHQIVNQVIAESGADSSAAAPDVYVASSTEFMRGLQEVLRASVQEIVEDLRVERDEGTRAALTAVVLTVAVVGLLVVLSIVLAIVLVVLASRRRSAVATGVRR
ncbi:nitrate- and nitrite sensing domain-containing protein [Nocardioides panzhihuensis]|uniref:Putative house-cleaning noncanonical NTP pyrophosphatase (MazG superfamily)/type II secretory pathway pseudopilin PulG n=1 Tax=Nocardioides panzhihuensis TaxID=860243 RepID=A0A7Z0DPR5_9ACTN|nr:nitrate- and nitrite sensing domain-containing protein [Nocardioides panzhihuensis]NYI79418.1 putative house-cleaning noncanonical NTP pyrophosphatase (MazG superfamily)/type II secretory pathway pseudopilin PulG [Nocardioides panzhihuensis]